MSGIDIKPLIGVTTPDLQGFFSVDSKIDQLLGRLNTSSLLMVKSLITN